MVKYLDLKPTLVATVHAAWLLRQVLALYNAGHYAGH